MKQKTILSVMLTMILIPILGISNPVYAQTTDPSSIERADDIRYRYKFENGELWRRLYNYSKGEWVGNWELVPD